MTTFQDVVDDANAIICRRESVLKSNLHIWDASKVKEYKKDIAQCISLRDAFQKIITRGDNNGYLR